MEHIDKQERLEMFNKALELVRTNDYKPLYSSPEDRLEMARIYAEIFHLELVEMDAE